jgi:hypothetical protein
MGVCMHKTQINHVIPTIPKSNDMERRKISLARRLVDMKRLDAVPALAIATSKLYQSRTKWKYAMSSGETLGSGRLNSSGSIEEIAKS